MYIVSVADRHLDITIRLQLVESSLVESSSLVSVLFREHLASPTSPFFSFTSNFERNLVEHYIASKQDYMINFGVHEHEYSVPCNLVMHMPCIGRVGNLLHNKQFQKILIYQTLFHTFLDFCTNHAFA